MLCKYSSLLLVAATLTFAIAEVTPIEDMGSGILDCLSGLHIIIPIGYDQNTDDPVEPVETIDLIALAKDIASEIPDSAAVAVHYPYVSLNTRGAYMGGVSGGATVLKNHVERYVDLCGYDSKIALLGYAQGALVATDAYVGSGSNQHTFDGFPDTSQDYKWSPGVGALDEEYARNVVGAAVFASPAAFFHEGYSRGTALSNGMFASARGPLNVDGTRFRSWCDEGDFLCAAVAVGKPKGSHTLTVKHYKKQAKEFIVEAFGKAVEDT